MDFTMNGISS